MRRMFSVPVATTRDLKDKEPLKRNWRKCSFPSARREFGPRSRLRNLNKRWLQTLRAWFLCAFKLWDDPAWKGSCAPAAQLYALQTSQGLGRNGVFDSPWLGNGSHAGKPPRCGAAPSSPPHHPPGCTCSSQASRKAKRPALRGLRPRFQTLQSRARFPGVSSSLGAADAVHCCCLELPKVRSSRGARLRASPFIPG